MSKKIKTKTLPFYRPFWSEMPPLKKFKKIMLSDARWHGLKNLPNDKEKKEICAWDGWHWILCGHLECFFGLKESFRPPNRQEQ